MEVSSSAIGAMRVGVQVISSHRKPLIEIYHQVHNRFGPEQEYALNSGHDESKSEIFKTRHQEIFIQFTMINIGGERAENIKLSITGELKREPPFEYFGGIFNSIYPQMAPGQIHYLFQFRSHDLNNYVREGNVGTPQGLKKSSFTITIEYDAPKSVLNWLLSIPSKIRGKRQFYNTYTFSPYMVDGDLPPAEYA
jgi:hypothetical protein